jgi:hypothetical protein
LPEQVTPEVGSLFTPSCPDRRQPHRRAIRDEVGAALIRKEREMRRFIVRLSLAGLAAAGFAGGCARSSKLAAAGDVERTVLKVENQGFPDMNVYVVPEGGARVRIGTVTGHSDGYFTLPEHLVRFTRQLSFQALPIATPRGPVSQSIVVTPGDTVVLTIPPS